jgi:hypothetical protein
MVESERAIVNPAGVGTKCLSRPDNVTGKACAVPLVLQLTLTSYELCIRFSKELDWTPQNFNDVWIVDGEPTLSDLTT